MTKITISTYRQFIHQNASAFNYDGTILLSQLRPLVGDRFGSNYLTIKTHLLNLQMYNLMSPISIAVYKLNPGEFPDMVEKPSVIAEREKLRAEARAEAEQLLKAKVKP
jgi:hypothetical protein